MCKTYWWAVAGTGLFWFIVLCVALYMMGPATPISGPEIQHQVYHQYHHALPYKNACSYCWQTGGNQ